MSVQRCSDCANCLVCNRAGHGRIRASDYKNAEHIKVSHTALETKQCCPMCTSGNLYEMSPAQHARVFGTPLLTVKGWDL